MKKQDRNILSLIALIFLPNVKFYYLNFHLPNFFIALINKMIGSSHSQLRKKNSCSKVELFGPRLSLKINISTKYGDARKYKHIPRIKKPGKFGDVRKIWVCKCSVNYVILPKR